MSLLKKIALESAVCLGAAGAIIGTIVVPALSDVAKYKSKILRDKPYFTGDSTSTYNPITQPPLVLPSNLSIPVINDVRLPAMEDRYVVAPRRLDNGKNGVSITPLSHSNDAYWFELLDLDGDHTTVEKKVVRQTFYHEMQIPFVSGSDIYFRPLRMDIAPIPTAEDHGLMERLSRRAQIQ